MVDYELSDDPHINIFLLCLYLSSVMPAHPTNQHPKLMPVGHPPIILESPITMPPNNPAFTSKCRTYYDFLLNRIHCFRLFRDYALYAPFAGPGLMWTWGDNWGPMAGIAFTPTMPKTWGSGF